MTAYQLLVVSNPGDTAPGRLVGTIKRRFAELGIPDGFLTVLSDADRAARDAKAPIVAVYFAADDSPALGPLMRELVADASTIVPVVRDLHRFVEMVPEEIRPYNGFQLDSSDTDMDRLSSVVLENFSLLRRSRRLFISYRRIETRGVAMQLYELLDAQGFDAGTD